jgi:hypothetical protein
VYVIGQDGGLRLRHRIERSARFGDTVFGPPWPASRVFPLPGGRSFAVAYHVRDQFPAVVQEFNARMEVVGEFWSAGYVSWYSRVTVGQRTLTLVGASYNQTAGASLAIFDGSVAGSAPATQAKYRCGDCPDGRPLTFLVFPRSRLQLGQGANASVLIVNPLSPTEYSVRVEQGRASDGLTASAYYRIDERGRILDAEMGAEFQALQLAIEREGKTTAATRYRGLADLLPVLRWTGNRFERVAQLER